MLPAFSEVSTCIREDGKDEERNRRGLQYLRKSNGKATTAIEREKRTVMNLRLAKIGYYERLSFTEAKGRHQCKQIKWNSYLALNNVYIM